MCAVCCVVCQNGLGIGDLEDLEVFVGLTTLHLHDNHLTALDNLDACSKLIFLNLANNNITKLSQLEDMFYLEVLDVSNNDITYLDIPVLPKALKHLKLRGNPCWAEGDKEVQDKLRRELIANLPFIQSIEEVVINNPNNP